MTILRSQQMIPKALLGVICLLLLGLSPGAGEELIDILPDAAEPIIEIGPDRLFRLLDYGVERELMIFEVLNAATLHLANLRLQARISGDSLRKAELRYDLGGERVRALLPISIVKEARLGENPETGTAFLEISLVESHISNLTNEKVGLLNEMDIRLSESYGFALVTPELFTEGYGGSVKRRLFGARLDSIEIYATGRIAIRVRGFSRPKRWRITRIKTI